MIKRSLLTLAILFPAALILGASAASAQGLAHWRSDEKGLEARRVRTLVSETEVAYLDNLTLTLGSADEWSPVEIAYGPDDLQARSERDPRSAGVKQARARGLWSKIGDLELLRFRFPSQEHAQRFAIYAAETQCAPTLLEVRGKQLVIARGERLRDPEDLQRIRGAAWEVLPHAPGAPSVAGLTLSRRDHAYELRIPNPELDRLVDGAFAEVEAKPSQGDVLEGPVLTQTWSGHASQVARYDDRKTLWVSRGSAQDGEPAIKALAEGMFQTSERLAQQAKESPALATRSLGKSRGVPQPVAVKPAQSKPAQSKPAQSKPVQSKPAQTKPARPRRDGFDTILEQAKRLDRGYRRAKRLRENARRSLLR